jgi:hypothetical protein
MEQTDRPFLCVITGFIFNPIRHDHSGGLLDLLLRVSNEHILSIFPDIF